MFKLDFVAVTPLMENTYIYHDGKEAVLFDPGGDFHKIDAFLEKNNLTVHSILNTHGHFDHIGAVGEVQKKYGCKFYIHKNDEPLIGDAKAISKMYGWKYDIEPKVDGYLNDGDKIDFNGKDITVIHTPGHTMGCVSFLIGENDDKILISGDTLFHESIGRTDLEQSDHPSIIKSIKEKLYTLDEDVTVYPGHGQKSSIGHEKVHNPFVKG